MSQRRRLVHFLGCAIILALLAVSWGVGITGQRHLVVTGIATYGLLWQLALIASPRRLERVNEHFVLVSIGLAAAWLLLEGIGFAGVVDYRRLLGPPELVRERPEYRYDPEMRLLRHPYLSMSGNSLGNIADLLHLKSSSPYPYELRYDQKGFRNERDLTTADVVVLGDSYIEAPLVAEPELMTSVLARLNDCVVANIALAGWGPGEELAALKRIGVPLRPRLAVWTFFEGNDPENLWNYQAWVERGRPRRGRPERWSFARGVTAALLGLLQETEQNPNVSRHVALFRTRAGDEVPVYFLAPPRADLDEEFFDPFRQVIEEAHAVTRELDAKLVFMFVPRKFRVYRETIEVPPRISRLRQWCVVDLPGQLRTVVKSVSPDIVFLDLTPALAAAATEGEMVYFPDDTHWSAAGHRVVAEALTAVLHTQESGREQGE